MCQHFSLLWYLAQEMDNKTSDRFIFTRWQRNSATQPVTTTQPALTNEQQLETLKKQAEYLKNELEKITRLIEAAESAKK